ncbi:MAG: hypothetical protein ABI056_07850, partial [Caulobacteraceae bacterium]
PESASLRRQARSPSASLPRGRPRLIDILGKAPQYFCAPERRPACPYLVWVRRGHAPSDGRPHAMKISTLLYSFSATTLAVWLLLFNSGSGI